jgi:hypothetical protein
MLVHLSSPAHQHLRVRGECAPASRHRRILGWLLAAGWAWVVATLGCETGAERARREEATALVRAIEALREAPNPGKRPLLKQLEQQPCSSEELCELKRVCTKAYHRHQRALDSARSLRHALRADAGPAASAGPTTKLVADAQRYLKRARFLSRRCTELQGKVSRRYDL